MRLIDADALTKKLEGLVKQYAEQGRQAVAEDYNFIITVLDTAPTVDAMGVVRCKDCIGKDTWYKDEICCNICGMSGLYAVENQDFCSYGERSTE